MPQNSWNQPKRVRPAVQANGLPSTGSFTPGRLTDEHHFAQDRSAGNRRRQHPRTAPALEQARDMLVEQLLFARSASHAATLITDGRTTDQVSTMLMMMQVTIGK